jgi:hypothetical protein
LDGCGAAKEQIPQTMKRTQAWKNFNLGQELSVSGAFIYNGLRRFHEMRVLDNTDEIFEVLYNFAVGLERLLKIAVVLLEHNETTDQDELEGLSSHTTTWISCNALRSAHKSIWWATQGVPCAPGNLLQKPSLRSIHSLFRV